MTFEVNTIASASLPLHSFFILHALAALGIITPVHGKTFFSALEKVLLCTGKSFALHSKNLLPILGTSAAFL